MGNRLNGQKMDRRENRRKDGSDGNRISKNNRNL